MEYPKFNSPTLIEALCEVRFSALSEDNMRRIPSILVSLLSEEYPLFEIANESPFMFNIGGNVISETIQRYKFSNEKHNYLITVKKDAFSFSLKHTLEGESHPYDKKKFYDKLCFEWKRVADKLGIGNILRIGVRFINFLEVEFSHNNGYYIDETSLYIPKNVLKSPRAFSNRNEYNIDNHNKLIVTSVSQKSSKNKAKIKELIIDIDRIIEDSSLLKGDVCEKAKSLHKDIEDVFFSSITENYKDLMKPKK